MFLDDYFVTISTITINDVKTLVHYMCEPADNNITMVFVTFACLHHQLVCSYLVALHQDTLHLFEQVLQVPAPQRLDDLYQRSSRHVTDLLETVPQQHTYLDQDAG